MSTQKPSDFVSVQLSPAGLACANGKSLRIGTGHLDYKFTGSAAVRVLTSEWSKVLSKQTYKGAAIFVVAGAAAADTQKLAALQAQEATLKTQIEQEEK